jgi:hypothetical protein
MLLVGLHILRTHEVVQEKPILCVANVKKNTKIGTKISFFAKKNYLTNFHSPQKMQIIHEIMCAHVEYKDIHANILPNFFTFINLFLR